MTDQHLDLRPVTSEALHFADDVEEIRADTIIVEDTSGLGSCFVKSRIPSGSGGAIFDVKFLQLILVDGDAKNGL